MTCTTALEVLLCLPPLHIYMKREAAQCAFRLLRRTTDLRPGAVGSHLGILRNFPEMTMLISMTDFRQKKFFFDHLFEVVNPDHQEWVEEEPCFEPCFEDNPKLWFTDASRQGLIYRMDNMGTCPGQQI